jgi:thymidylate synthase (FAD)
MRVELLDHGYIDLVESWGSDERIIEAARMSTGKGFQGWGPMHGDGCPLAGEQTALISSNRGLCRAYAEAPVPCAPKTGDEKLLAYLWNNKHATPFEMAGLVIEVKAPIMVFREWHRHRTQSYNELSARYTPLPAEDYLPTTDRTMINSGATNKQAGTVQGSDVLNEEQANRWLARLFELYLHEQDVYEDGLNIGIPKELARLATGVARYSRMRASANLRNWLAFLTLRMAPNAQWEIRQYANAVGKLISNRFPRTWELFADGEAA